MKVCILGFGGIAKSHARGYFATMNEGKEQTLVAVCDICPERFSKLEAINLGGSAPLDLSKIAQYTDWEEMLDKEQPDLVDICLPTYLHCEYAVKVMEKGYNVQCEKPLGLNKAECDTILAAAKRTGRQLFVGMCLRFEPLYLELKKMIDDRRYGEVKSAVFDRLSALPLWGFENWFPDVKRSGGVALDLHIHDVDIIRYLFGEPTAVTAATASSPECECITIHSTFHYDNKMITAIGDWGRAQGTPFSMSYAVNFETATVLSDTNGNITVFPSGGEPFAYEYQHKDRMRQEELYFASVLGGAENTVISAEDAARSVEVVEILKQSAARGGERIAL